MSKPEHGKVGRNTFYEKKQNKKKKQNYYKRILIQAQC